MTTRRKSSKTLSTSFSSYIEKLLKSSNKNDKIGIVGNALATVNNLTVISLRKVIVQINLLTNLSKRKTLSPRDVHTAIQLAVHNPELQSLMLTAASKSVAKFSASKTREKKKIGSAPAVRRSEAAGLIFPVSRIERLIKTLVPIERKSSLAPVYLTGAVQALIAYLLEFSSQAATHNKRQRITSRHVLLAVRYDAGLNDLYSDVVLSGGTIPSETKPERPSKKSTPKKKPLTKRSESKKATKEARKSSEKDSRKSSEKDSRKSSEKSKPEKGARKSQKTPSKKK